MPQIRVSPENYEKLVRLKRGNMSLNDVIGQLFAKRKGGKHGNTGRQRASRLGRAKG